jgi:TIR domain/Pentapeptide repeats (8 copies)
MANKEHLAQLMQGVIALAGADLRGADLTRAHLTGVDLRKANLTGADLGRVPCILTDFCEADLTGANLGRADLSLANLCRANLQGADLQETNLQNVDLQMANLSGAKLTGANFLGAKVGGTIFGDVDLSTVQELETVRHQGPSVISIETLYRSRGQIPDIFLRRTGVPEDMITHVKALVERPFEFYSCFISYSSRDQEFAERLYADLQNKGVSCWFAPHDVQGGRKLHEQIDQAIRLYERLLLILSTHSMQSEWVKTEIATARQREVQEKRQVLFPISLVSFEAIRNWECFDADTGKDSAREIREYFIPDFSDWKDRNAYQAAFQRLLRDLKPNTILL